MKGEITMARNKKSNKELLTQALLDLIIGLLLIIIDKMIE